VSTTSTVRCDYVPCRECGAIPPLDGCSSARCPVVKPHDARMGLSGHTEPPPKQYTLLHHAAAFARQCEAAGLPEGKFTPQPRERTKILLTWHREMTEVWIHDNGQVSAFDFLSGADTGAPDWSFRVGGPLPPELIAAIKAAEGA
jgi:hypothetical protein